MKNKGKISIIIPIYNSEKYLIECLDSIINQTYHNLEIICVDDGSNDGSAIILNDYALKDSRVRVIKKGNTGVSDSRNRGLDIATGEYIGFVDSDDVIEKNMYELLVNLMKEYNSDVSICSFTNIPNKAHKEECYLLTPKQAIYEMNRGKYFMGHLANKLFKSYLWKEIRLNTSLSIWEDLVALHYVFDKANAVVFKNVGLYFYRPNEQSALNSNFNTKYLSIFKSANEISSFISGKYPSCIDMAKKNRMFACFLVIEKICQSGLRKRYKAEIRSYLKDFRKDFRFKYIFDYQQPMRLYLFSIKISFALFLFCKKCFFIFTTFRKRFVNR